MSIRRKLVLFAAPVVGAAALGGIVAFSVPALAASPSPSPAASSSPSTSSPSTTAPAQHGACPNM